MNITFERLIKVFTIVLGVGLFLLFFVSREIGGDIHDVVWRVKLLRVHLASELSMPYFTPGRCGGFLLAASGHDILFSIYMITGLIIPHAILSIKIANFFLSIIFATGFFFLLKKIGIQNQIARGGASILIVISGYWFNHLSHAGHWPVHGLAYLPFIMVLIESILEERPVLKGQLVGRCLLLSGLFFLLINSGYYWLQIAAPVIGARIIIQLLFFRRNANGYLHGIGIVVLCGIIGILLSLPRLGGIYEFQITKFPRAGGAVPHYGVIGDNLILLDHLLRSFFDRRIITEMIHSRMLGSFWEYSNFIGVVSIVAILVGVTRLITLFKSKIFLALLLASIFQILMIRTTHMADAVRWLFPVYNQISWYWRGSAILIFLAVVVIAIGYETIFRSKRKKIILCGVMLMFLSLAEIVWTNPPGPNFWALTQNDAYGEPTKPLTEPYAVCLLTHIFGYGTDLADWKLSHYKETKPGFYNLHDVRRLASAQANDGYYMTHDWPLWPKEDQTEFEKFINYHQVIEIPLYLRTLNYISLFVWLAFIVVGGQKITGYIVTLYRKR